MATRREHSKPASLFVNFHPRKPASGRSIECNGLKCGSQAPTPPLRASVNQSFFPVQNPSEESRVDQVLRKFREGNAGASDELFELVYGEFRALAQNLFRRERAQHTLQPTALVHEAYVRLVNQKEADWKGRSHFYAAGARAMRRVLVDHARQGLRDKRGGGANRITLSDIGLFETGRLIDALDLNDALLELAQLDSQQAQLVELRFFTGLTLPDAAKMLELSKRTAEREWTMAKAWLRKRLDDRADS